MFSQLVSFKSSVHKLRHPLLSFLRPLPCDTKIPIMSLRDDGNNPTLNDLGSWSILTSKIIEIILILLINRDFKGKIAGFRRYRYIHIFEENLRSRSSQSYLFYHPRKFKGSRHKKMSQNWDIVPTEKDSRFFNSWRNVA